MKKIYLVLAFFCLWAQATPSLNDPDLPSPAPYSDQTPSYGIGTLVNYLWTMAKNTAQNIHEVYEIYQWGKQNPKKARNIATAINWTDHHPWATVTIATATTAVIVYGTYAIVRDIIKKSRNKKPNKPSAPAKIQRDDDAASAVESTSLS